MMKLFVWADPYRISYGTSGFFAVAETVEQAREIAKSSPRYRYVEFHQEDGEMTEVVLGEPTRIVGIPCGEWHEWSE